MNNTKSSKNNIILSTFVLLFFLALISILIYFLKKYANNDRISGMKEYKIADSDVKLPLKGNGKNMNTCLPGCIRGVCSGKGGNNCKYDFQCQYCQDVKTNMFYVNFDNEREIVPLYQEEKNLTLPQKNLLNNEIKKNNEYIHKLNERIKLIESFM
jgi:hypothetical protein